MNESRQRLKISNLEAKIALIEIESAELAREVRSPLTSVKRRDEVIANRDNALAQASSLREELEMPLQRNSKEGESLARSETDRRSAPWQTSAPQLLIAYCRMEKSLAA